MNLLIQITIITYLYITIVSVLHYMEFIKYYLSTYSPMNLYTIYCRWFESTVIEPVININMYAAIFIAPLYIVFFFGAIVINVLVSLIVNIVLNLKGGIK